MTCTVLLIRTARVVLPYARTGSLQCFAPVEAHTAGAAVAWLTDPLEVRGGRLREFDGPDPAVARGDRCAAGVDQRRGQLARHIADMVSVGPDHFDLVVEDAQTIDSFLRSCSMGKARVRPARAFPLKGSMSTQGGFQNLERLAETPLPVQFSRATVRRGESDGQIWRQVAPGAICRVQGGCPGRFPFQGRRIDP